MERIEDLELHGVAHIYDSPQAVAATACREGRQVKLGISDCFYDAAWIGRDGITSWPIVELMSRDTWVKGLQTIARMRDALESSDIPSPLALRRELQFNDDCGELDIERLLADEERCFSRMEGVTTITQRKVTLTFTPGENSWCDPEKMIWRGAAIAALSDLLESNGYSVEVWGWTNALQVFEDHPTLSSCFVAYCVKPMGEPVDNNTMANAVSAWFFRTAILGSYHVSHHNHFKRSNGGIHDYYGRTEFTWGKWDKYIPFAPDSVVLQMPGHILSEGEAIDAAKRLIGQLAADED